MCIDADKVCPLLCSWDPIQAIVAITQCSHNRPFMRAELCKARAEFLYRLNPMGNDREKLWCLLCNSDNHKRNETTTLGLHMDMHVHTITSKTGLIYMYECSGEHRRNKHLLELKHPLD